MIGTDPMLYYEMLEDTIIKDMENNDEIVKDSRIYKLVAKYLLVLLYGNIQFSCSDTSYSTSADMLYNITNKHSYNKIELGCTISAKLCKTIYGRPTKYIDIEILPSLELSYKNITTTRESKPIYVKDEYHYSFYQIYIDTKKSLKDLIKNDYDMENGISNIIDIEYLSQDMAMLITLFYMKNIVSADNYSKFLKLDEKEENIVLKDTNHELKQYSGIVRRIFDIESSLYEIGAIDPNLLEYTLKKISSIVDESKSKIKPVI